MSVFNCKNRKEKMNISEFLIIAFVIWHFRDNAVLQVGIPIELLLVLILNELRNK